MALIGVGDGAPTPEPQPFGPIRVIESAHRIEFPDRIVFSLEAESTSRITEVTLFYKSGTNDIVTYGYPQFVQGRQVKTTFSVKTSGSNFLPSGSDFEYRYMIRDAEGRSFETQAETFEYLDPAHEWQRVQKGDLVLLYHDRNRESVERVVDEASVSIERVKTVFDLGRVRPIKAVILSNRAESRESFPMISETANRNHVFGGFAFGEYGVFVLGGLDTDGIVHESTHLLLDEAVSTPFVQIPSWLNEGLAQYFESDRDRSAPTVARAASSNRLMRIRAMGSVPGRPEDVGLFYAQAWSFVSFLMVSRGDASMTNLLDLLNRGMNLEDAIVQSYGASLDELEIQWRDEIGGAPAITPIYDPGQVGTSALIATAAAFSALVMIWRWIRGTAVPVDDADVLDPDDADM